jgi:hypothetical protein
MFILGIALGLISPLLFLFFAFCALIMFFVTKPGDIIGACPVCDYQNVMGWTSSTTTACNKCHHRIKIDHERKVFIETDDTVKTLL